MQNRNFNTVLKDIKAYVTKNPERKVPEVYKEVVAEPSKMNEEEYCPPNINLEQLSSSEEQKLRQRGVIRKVIKKAEEKPKDQQKWEHSRFDDLVRKKERRDRHQQKDRHHRHRRSDSNEPKEAARPNTEKTYKLSFKANKQQDQNSIWKLFSKDRIFIREVRIDNDEVTVKFANQESALRSSIIVEKENAGGSIVCEGPNGQPLAKKP